MGFGTIASWDEFNAAIADLKAAPGVFASDVERATVIGAIQGAIAHEQDTSKKLQMASDLVGVVKGAGLSLASLKSTFGFLAAVIPA